MGETLAVLGAGSFGTALATQLARCGHKTLLWGRDGAVLDDIRENHRNQKYLPNARLPEELIAEADLQKAVAGSRDVVVAVPSHALRETLAGMKQHMPAGQRIICAAKGLEPETGKLAHEVCAETLGESVGFSMLSGPTFAKEIVAGNPTAVSIASSDIGFAEDVAEYFHSGVFRAYTNDDVVGVEVGGSVKNVLAIAVGCADGLGFGANTRTLIITRGLSEMMRLGEALGSERDTFMGLAGMGDLILTCTDDQSRNRRMGLALAAGKSPDEAMTEIQQVVEGYRVAPEVKRLGQRLGVEMPITQQVYMVMYASQTPLEAVKVLCGRPSRSEN